MSVGKNPSPPPRREAGKVEGGQNAGDAVQETSGGKKPAADQRRYARCFSGLDLSVGSGPLSDVDAGKLRGQIRRWARAVVAYARQLSFGSPRSSPRMSSHGATPSTSARPSLPTPTPSPASAAALPEASHHRELRAD